MKVTSTRIQNLVQAENGIYYARIHRRPKIIWRSLRTSVESVAKMKLRDVEKELEESRPQKVLHANAKVEQAAILYRLAVENNSRLKPAAKDFRLRQEKTMRRTWKTLFETELRRVTPEACEAWLQRFENGGSIYTPTNAKTSVNGDSPTTVNACIAYLRRVFDIAIAQGLTARNPAKGLQRKKPSVKTTRMPNKVEYAGIVKSIRSNGTRWSELAGDVVEGIAYCGARIDELRGILWQDIDWERGTVAIDGTKTRTSFRTNPMTEAFVDLLGRIRKGGRPSATERIFKANVAERSLANACREVGVNHLTHKDLRDYFATTCIESGVDIPAVSRWLGHADGGALLLKTYNHLRPEHSTEAVKKVKFV